MLSPILTDESDRVCIDRYTANLMGPRLKRVPNSLLKPLQKMINADVERIGDMRRSGEISMSESIAAIAWLRGIQLRLGTELYRRENPPIRLLVIQELGQV